MDSGIPAARQRRSWPQRFLITFNCLLIAMCVMAASALGYSYYRFGNIPRVALGDFLANEPPGQPQNYLLVGSDSRAFVDGQADQDSFGDVQDEPGQRADTIILVRVDPKSETASMISFPRDLILPIAGRNERDRINTAFAGGPSQLIKTLQTNFNVPIHHYVQVDFQGFRGLVEAVGGVDVYLKYPVRDRNCTDAEGCFNPSGLDIEETGCVTLNGDRALSYVRSRHFEQFIDGRWQGTGRADLERIERQQAFIATAVRQAIAKGLTNPTKLTGLMGVAERSVTIDQDLEPQDLLTLAQRFRSIEPGTLTRLQLPVKGANFGGATNNVVVVDEPKADGILDVFRGIVPGQEVVAPSAVQARVLNGSGRGGEASQVRQSLSTAGFTMTDASNAPSTVARTTLRYGPGQSAKAELLASYFDVPPSLVEDSTITTVDVVVVTGQDYAGILQTPRPVETSPTSAPPDAAPPADQEIDAAEPTC